MPIANLLLPEFHEEIKRTRKTLEALPEGQAAFKPHERSSALSKLAGHLAELPLYLSVILTAPDVDLAVGAPPPTVFETKPQVLAAFEEFADKALTALKNTTDETFEQHWKLSAGPRIIFSGTRYDGYRMIGINHMVHHRAQVGVYLRLLHEPVPSIYGPSADNAS